MAGDGLTACEDALSALHRPALRHLNPAQNTGVPEARPAAMLP
jgi:hypothetical protein